MKARSFILTGFDRSGTSAISRTLATHPKVELVFRPFNGGSIREKMYIILSEENIEEEDRKFFSELEEGRFQSSYVVSGWHVKYSTIKDKFVDDHLHVLITNLNHFSVRWLSCHYPGVENWAIWRDPYDIVQSCYDNNFLGDWYKDSLRQVFRAVRTDPGLRRDFLGYEDRLDDDVKSLAYLLAVRNTFLFANIGRGKLVDYDLFKMDPNSALRPILEYFSLPSDVDFSAMLGVDLNSVPGKNGYQRGVGKSYSFSAEQMGFMEELFIPLYREYEGKRDAALS